MAEEKKTTSTRTKSTTAKSSTAKTTAAKTTTTKKTTGTKTTKATTTKTAASKTATSKLSAAEREKKEALRKEVLEHYTRQQNYRATTPSYSRPPVYEYEEPKEEEVVTPIPTSQEYFEERGGYGPANSVYTRNTATLTAEQSDIEPEASAYTPSEPLTPTYISNNPKITSLNSKKKDPYRREKVRESIKGFLAQDGLFYFFGFIALIGVIVIMLT